MYSGESTTPTICNILQASVDDGGERVADFELVGVDERLAGERLVVAARSEPAAAAEIELIEPRPTDVGNRDEPS